MNKGILPSGVSCAEELWSFQSTVTSQEFPSRLLEPLSWRGDVYYVLVYPDVAVSTAWAYGRVELVLTDPDPYTKFVTSLSGGCVDCWELEVSGRGNTPRAKGSPSGHGQAGLATSAHCIVLPEGEARANVMSALRASTEMLPPTARRVGALHVGYLPVAATWD